MHWPKENSVSVVPQSSVYGGTASGDECQVKMGGAKHKGKVWAIGKLD